jgi:hypothetical protein
LDLSNSIASWLIPLVVTLLGGGLGGAIFKTLYDRRQARTHPIPLIELVNSNPLSYDIEGIKLVRVDGGTEVTNLRHYELLLRNTSGTFLRDAHFQLKVKQADRTAVTIVAGPSKSKADLISVDARPIQPPWVKAFAWKIPQFADGDSIRFRLQALNQADLDFDDFYEGFIDSGNVICEKTKGLTGREAHPASLILAAAGLILSVSLTYYSWRARESTQETFEKAIATANEWLATHPPDPHTAQIEDGPFRIKLISFASKTDLGWLYTYIAYNYGADSIGKIELKYGEAILMDAASLFPDRTAVRTLNRPGSPGAAQELDLQLSLDGKIYSTRGIAPRP